MKPIQACFVCKERRGTFHREVREVSPSKFLEAYLSMNLGEAISPIKDLKRIYSPNVRVMLVDDIGVLMQGPLTDVRGWPDVHVAFWDRVLVGREEMCYTLAEIVAQDARVGGVWTAIPKEARATIAFAKRVGFKVTQETESLLALSLAIYTV